MLYDVIICNDVISAADSYESVKDVRFTMYRLRKVLLSNMSRPETFGLALIMLDSLNKIIIVSSNICSLMCSLGAKIPEPSPPKSGCGHSCSEPKCGTSKSEVVSLFHFSIPIGIFKDFLIICIAVIYYILYLVTVTLHLMLFSTVVFLMHCCEFQCSTAELLTNVIVFFFML